MLFPLEETRIHLHLKQTNRLEGLSIDSSLAIDLNGLHQLQRIGMALTQTYHSKRQQRKGTTMINLADITATTIQ